MGFEGLHSSSNLLSTVLQKSRSLMEVETFLLFFFFFELHHIFKKSICKKITICRSWVICFLGIDLCNHIIPFLMEQLSYMKIGNDEN